MGRVHRVEHLFERGDHRRARRWGGLVGIGRRHDPVADFGEDALPSVAVGPHGCHDVERRRIEFQAALGFFIIMAFQAILRDEGLDVLGKDGFRPGGLCAGGSGGGGGFGSDTGGPERANGDEAGEQQEHAKTCGQWADGRDMNFFWGWDLQPMRSGYRALAILPSSVVSLPGRFKRENVKPPPTPRLIRPRLQPSTGQ